MSAATDIIQRIDINTGETVNYREVTKWHDGTAMTDAKCDGVIYRKKEMKYFVLSKFVAGEQIPVSYFGAKGDGTTDDTVAIQKAINSNLINVIYLPRGKKYKVTSFSNTLGKIFVGEGKILQDNIQLNTYADQNQRVFGQEYLYAFLNHLKSGTVDKKIISSGDSTSDDPTYQAVLSGLFSAHSKLVFVDSATSGENSTFWKNTALPYDLTNHPDMILYLWRWGINDLGDHLLTLSNLDAGLTTLRAAKGVGDLSVVIMMPNAVSDTQNGRDEKYFESLRGGLAAMARKHQCCFIDIYGTFQDSRRGAAGKWYDDPFGDGRAVHPQVTLINQIASLIYESIVPLNMRSQSAGLDFNTATSKLGADPPNSYPLKISNYRALTGFPVEGGVITIRNSWSGTAMQINQPLGGAYGDINNGWYVRFGNISDNTWGEWTRIKTSVDFNTATTKVATDLPNTYPFGISNFQALTGFPSLGMVHTVKNSWSGTAAQFVYPLGGTYGDVNGGYYVRFGVVGDNTWGEWSAVGKKMDAQANSTATDLAGLLSDFNALLTKLRAAWLMKI